MEILLRNLLEAHIHELIIAEEQSMALETLRFSKNCISISRLK